MLKTRKRWISLLVTLAMLVAFVVPFAGTANAGAATYKTLTSVQSFDASDKSASSLTTATVRVEIDPPITQPSTARVEVLDGSGAQLDIYKILVYQPTRLSVAKVIYGNNTANIDLSQAVTEIDLGTNPVQSFDINVTPGSTTDKANFDFALVVDAKDAAAGDVKVNFFNCTGQFDPGSVVVARAASSGSVSVALVGSIPNIGEDSDKEITIRLTEASKGALNVGDKTVKIKLPSGFKWTGGSSSFDYTTYGGPKGTVTTDEARELYVNIETKSTTAYTVDIKNKIAVDDLDVAKKGDVVATLEGRNSTTVTPGELTVATYADYGVDLTVASVKDFIAGKAEDNKTDKIKLEEKIPGSLITGRKVTIKFPDWAKVKSGGVTVESSSNINYTLTPPDGTGSKVEFKVNSTTSGSKAKLEFKVDFNIEANRSGDLVATVSGAGIPETELTVAKVLNPVEVTVGTADVKIGSQEQSVPDITITENKAGAIKQSFGNSKARLALVLPEGVKFVGTPKVEVTSGDLDIDDDQVRITDESDITSYGSDRVLDIPIKSESVKASTIKISGIKLTLDRTVPEGPLTVKVSGTAVVQNYGSDDDEFRTDYAAKFALANCVTPAPGEQKGTAVFKIGEKKYTVNGQEVEMDVAPVAEAGRTYLPARFVANAMGVPDANIIWDQASKTVTVIRGERFVQMKVGSKQILVNGVTLNMDVAPKVVPGRVLIPFRFLAQALGAEVVWDAADPNTITLNF